VRLPCKDCITLGMCKGRFVYKNYTNNRFYLNANILKKCTLLRDYRNYIGNQVIVEFFNVECMTHVYRDLKARRIE
jgi:hypothetical protein